MPDIEKVSPSLLLKMKKEKRKITMLTAYDYYFAKVVEDAGCDIILVGDSLGSVILGHKNTIPVTVDDMVHHIKAVSRGVTRAMLVGDMPFMSYQVSREEAIRNAGYMIKEGRAHAVKLEGGESIAPTVGYLTDNGIPVMGHVGLMPQRVHEMGGYKIQGKSPETEKKIINDALSLQDAGAFAVVLEGIPAGLASKISKKLRIPTIGIGAGPGCDGQVLVIYDMLNMTHERLPRFVRVFSDAGAAIKKGVADYIAGVREGEFPAESHTFRMSKRKKAD